MMVLLLQGHRQKYLVRPQHSHIHLHLHFTIMPVCFAQSITYTPKRTLIYLFILNLFFIKFFKLIFHSHSSEYSSCGHKLILCDALDKLN